MPASDNSLAQATAHLVAPVIAAAPWTRTEALAEIAAATAQVRAAWIQTGAEAVIASEIEAYLRVVVGRVAPLVVLPVVRVAPVPAVRGVPQAWAAGEVPVVAVAGDGGN